MGVGVSIFDFSLINGKRGFQFDFYDDLSFT